MNNLTMCQQFLSLIQIYTIQYICTNYDIYCDNYCYNDTEYNCYCFCKDDNIYCYNRYYYYSKLISVIFFGLLISILCICIYNCLIKKNNNLPSYYDIYNIKQNKENLEK